MLFLSLHSSLLILLIKNGNEINASERTFKNDRQREQYWVEGKVRNEATVPRINVILKDKKQVYEVNYV